MTVYTWYKIFNLNEFDNLNIPSVTKDLFLEGIGFESILVAKGTKHSILFRDTLLPVAFEDLNPFALNGYAVYHDDNYDIWLGIEVVEEE